MARFSKEHESASLSKARELMEKCGYSDTQVKLVVDDAIRLHSCNGDERHSLKKALVLATADSLAHPKETDFYVFASWSFGKDQELDVLKAWVMSKIDRDLYIKISFEEERKDALPDYEAIKSFSHASLVCLNPE